jgi:peptidoglycan/LPS O-acetylase OafA/YrhL
MRTANAQGAHRYIVLDGLRGVAALAVLAYHGVGRALPLNPLVHAPSAVDFFFLLSGFVIGCAYEEKLVSGRLTFWGFVHTRLVRLYPLIFLGAIFTAVALAARISFQDARQLAGAAATIAGALTLVPVPLHQLAPKGVAGGAYINAPEWSLFWELAINFGYAAVAPRLKSRHLVIAVVVGAAGLALNGRFNSLAPADWRLLISGLPRVVFSFSLGLLLYRLRSGRVWSERGVWPLLLAALLAVILLSPRATPWDGVLLTVFAFPPLVFAATHMIPGPRAAWLADWCGRLSYPVYILNFPVLLLFDQFLGPPAVGAGRLWSLTFEVPAIVAVAWVALVLFDQPIRRAFAHTPSARLPSSPKDDLKAAVDA